MRICELHDLFALDQQAALGFVLAGRASSLRLPAGGGRSVYLPASSAASSGAMEGPARPLCLVRRLALHCLALDVLSRLPGAGLPDAAYHLSALAAVVSLPPLEVVLGDLLALTAGDHDPGRTPLRRRLTELFHLLGRERPVLLVIAPPADIESLEILLSCQGPGLLAVVLLGQRDQPWDPALRRWLRGYPTALHLLAPTP